LEKTKESRNKIAFIVKDPSARIAEFFITLIGVLAIMYGFHESNRLSWLSDINSNSLEFSKMEIEKNYLACLYPIPNNTISRSSVKLKNSCTSVYNNILIIHKTTAYLEENLDFFLGVIDYDKEYHENEFFDTYYSWFESLYLQENTMVPQFRTPYINEKIQEINDYIESSN